MSKIKNKMIIFIFASVLVFASVVLSGCQGGVQASGPEYIYNVIKTGDKYEFTGNVITTVVPDSEVVVDGKFNESFYSNLKWFKGHKILKSKTGEVLENGTLDLSVYFAKTGFVIAVKITDSERAYHSTSIATGNISGFNCYFAFGDAKEQKDGVYEIECTAGNRFKISKFGDSGLAVVPLTLDITPVTAVVRDGDILEGTCFNYDMEMFLPYKLFGRENVRPNTVYLNPTQIKAVVDEYGVQIQDLRTWYNYGYEQSPEISQWGKPNQGYVFGNEGFISNTITIKSTGGKVTEEWGYDWCLTGDSVKFNVVPDSGKSLTKLTVNGVDRMGSVSNNALSVYCNGDISVVAEFA